MKNKSISRIQAKTLLRAATQLSNVTGSSKSDALLVIVKSLAEYKGLSRAKG